MTLLQMVTRTSYIHLLALLVRGMAKTCSKLLLILARVEPTKFMIPIKASGYLMASWQAIMWTFVALGCGCCIVARFPPSSYHLFQDP